MNDQKIISPCISICKTDYSTGYCYGCARTEEGRHSIAKHPIAVTKRITITQYSFEVRKKK